jgi:hypothetical protein
VEFFIPKILCSGPGSVLVLLQVALVAKAFMVVHIPETCFRLGTVRPPGPVLAECSGYLAVVTRAASSIISGTIIVTNSHGYRLEVLRHSILQVYNAPLERPRTMTYRPRESNPLPGPELMGTFGNMEAGI